MSVAALQKPMTGKELRELIRKSGSNQCSVAELIGVDRCTVNRWCNDKLAIPLHKSMLLRVLLAAK